ncbi:caspase family protein [Pectobacterium aquaticum]|uniref:caspase family protein n=1 Tax=Pectobacterium aquaticum TaxID=2204145 RepID=UPI001F11910C|nr:caspase family protein [Pectobacterium aquaticum]MCH5051058.1 caspase family protein [Pectobacterium aquaticum]
MRIALIVGINYYEYGSPLYGCVDDAHSINAVLSRHGDGSVNFDCKIFTGTGPTDKINRSLLKDNVEELFKTNADTALFYFAGHGHIEATGGYLLATDSSRGDEGLSLADVLVMANNSPARNRIIILDSCHSGIAGTPPNVGDLATLSEGLTILTASSAEQYATEENGRGVFTALLVDALHGGAANLTGDVSPGSVYAHVDQSLGGWEQRPIFKTNVRQFVSLRKVEPQIPLIDLHRLIELFPQRGFEFKLDPTFEPELKGRDDNMPDPILENTRVFSLLQRYNRLNLVVPVGAPHMWHAAMQSKSCKLTVLGEHYRRLVEKKRI